MGAKSLNRWKDSDEARQERRQTASKVSAHQSEKERLFKRDRERERDRWPVTTANLIQFFDNWQSVFGDFSIVFAPHQLD